MPSVPQALPEVMSVWVFENAWVHACILDMAALSFGERAPDIHRYV